MERFLASLAALGIAEPRVKQFDASTATAADAAAAIGTTLGQIVKSLVFLADEQPIMVLVSGSNRVDTRRLGELVGARITRADADRVRNATGYAIGGVPPLGHASRLATYVDRDLLQYDEVWAAAGTSSSVFSIAPATLLDLTQGRIADLA